MLQMINHSLYKTDCMEINKTSYEIFNLRHVTKVAAHFHTKNKMFICLFIKIHKQKRREKYKIACCRAVFRTMSEVSMMER